MSIELRCAAIVFTVTLLGRTAAAQDCSIKFDSTCPDATPECGATFSGGSSCIIAGLALCYDTGALAYQVGPGQKVDIALSQPIESLTSFLPTRAVDLAP